MLEPGYYYAKTSILSSSWGIAHWNGETWSFCATQQRSLTMQEVGDKVPMPEEDGKLAMNSEKSASSKMFLLGGDVFDIANKNTDTEFYVNQDGGKLAVVVTNREAIVELMKSI